MWRQRQTAVMSECSCEDVQVLYSYTQHGSAEKCVLNLFLKSRSDISSPNTTDELTVFMFCRHCEVIRLLAEDPMHVCLNSVEQFLSFVLTMCTCWNKAVYNLKSRHSIFIWKCLFTIKCDTNVQITNKINIHCIEN